MVTRSAATKTRSNKRSTGDGATPHRAVKRSKQKPTGQDVFEVDGIKDMKTVSVDGSDEVRFLVGWSGYDGEDTWEPRENLPSRMVSTYLKAHANEKVRSDSPAVSQDAPQAKGKPIPLQPKQLRSAKLAANVDFVTTSELDKSTSAHNANADSDEAKHQSDESTTASRPQRAGPVEFDVDGIKDVKTVSENGQTSQMFLVAWTGYDEDTWEPRENLPADMVSTFLASVNGNDHPIGGTVDTVLSSATDTLTILPEVIKCATCGDGPEGLASSCGRCQRPMHHFCATDICKSLGLRDAAGEELLEFPNDTCYCSKVCYSRRVGAIRDAKKKRATNRSDSDDDSDYDDSTARLRPNAPSIKKSVRQPSRSSASQLTNPPPSPVSTSMWPPRKPKATPPKPLPVAVRKERDPLVGKMVAFCADKEDWMPAKLYREAKGLYLSGRVFAPKRVVGQRIGDDIYEVRWTVTHYQTKAYFHRVTRAKVEEGVHNYSTISGGILNKATWSHICKVPDSEAVNEGTNLDDYVILDGSSDLFIAQQVMPDNLELVEQIKNLDFQPSKRMTQPPDLFTQDDGSTGSKLIKEKRHYFETASSSFFAYLPVSFWRTVVCESNEYATGQKGAAITLDELMCFFGMLFYMKLVGKGEYSNHWGAQIENRIPQLNLKDAKLGIEGLMSKKRFQFIRKNLCFRCNVTVQELKKDPAARIRPLINMLKYTSTKYVVLGRNVAVDESSIACRSKYGRHLIVFNASKPTGKFHFKIYGCCCATSWLMVGFRLHCSSDLEDRLEGVVNPVDARYLEDRLQFSSSVRQIVLEVTQPIHNTNRIVNTDNFYTSIKLLLSLRDVGLYGRGTIREASAHFPKAHMFAKKAKEPRGSSLQGVSKTGQIIAASWMDGSAVNLISSADSSDMGEVTRKIGSQSIKYPAPMCLAEYNQHMQGVDRLDQLRSMYSLADGHSMQKWHKKLGLAFIDIARVNAYVTKCLRSDVDPKTAARNVHRDFVEDLAVELMSGTWKDTVEDEGMLFADEQITTASMSTSGSPRTPTLSPSPVMACEFVLSSTQFPDATRGKRGCKVCQFEGRVWTMKTNYCVQHNVCLCSKAYPIDSRLATVVCPQPEWSCWRKYHDYYLPQGVFNANGHIRRSSTVFQARRKLQLDTADQPASTASATNSVVSPAVDVYSPLHSISAASPASTITSPPTLVFSPFVDSGPDDRYDPHRDRPVVGGFVETLTSSFVSFQSPREIVSTATSEDYTNDGTVQI